MLELKNVSKTFNPGTVNEKKALDKLSLNLNEGDFVTIIGANGAEKVLNLTKSIIAEHHLTCMMITHNMQSALELGNRTFMMNSGHIIFDTANEERSKLTVNDLLERFKEGVGKQLDNDRMLLS